MARIFKESVARRVLHSSFQFLSTCWLTYIRRRSLALHGPTSSKDLPRTRTPRPHLIQRLADSTAPPHPKTCRGGVRPEIWTFRTTEHWILSPLAASSFRQNP